MDFTKLSDIGSVKRRPMLKEIVIVKDDADGDERLRALIYALFPECEVVTVCRKGHLDVQEGLDN
ncbi:MAG: hypothetical protein P8175_11495 [Deltaproteobacteria bacterium]